MQVTECKVSARKTSLAFQISRLFRVCLPVDFSPGQEEQPMFWFLVNISLFLQRKFYYKKTNIHIWALARAPDLHLNIHQLVTSSNNTTQHTIKVPRLPD